MPKKKHKRHNYSSHQAVPSSNIIQKSSFVAPSVWESISEKAKEVSQQVVQTFQYTTFGLFTLSRINTEVFDGILVEWRDRFTGGLGVIGKQKCSDSGKMICSKIGNNGTVFSATRVQYYRQQCCSTSKGSIFLIYSFIGEFI